MLDTLDISVILLVILYHAVLYVAVKKMIDVAMIRSYVVVTTQDYLKKLQDALVQAGLRWQGEPVWARFDPPWKPWFMRRNEIWLELD